MDPPLLHLATPAQWRAHLAAGVIAPSVAEFVHLSTPAQVALPANRLFAGRGDLLLLALDPARIGVAVRFEPGLPTDPASMRFPHAYGPIPTAAVLAVLPYRAHGDFRAPVLPVLDAAGRQAAFEPSWTRRAATREVPVRGGVAVRTDAAPASHQHNRLLLDRPADPAAVVADADRVLDGLDHRAALLVGDALAGTAAGLAERGWAVEPLVGMAGPAQDGAAHRVEQLDAAALRPVREARWRRVLPGTDDEVITQLVDRVAVEEPVIDVRHLAVRERGEVVASALLRIDGATAELDAVETEPEHRGRGHGDVLLAGARAVAGAAGCDLVTLAAAVEDRPRHWYARRGFTEVDRSWAAVAPQPGT